MAETATTCADALTEELTEEQIEAAKIMERRRKNTDYHRAYVARRKLTDPAFLNQVRLDRRNYTNRKWHEDPEFRARETERRRVNRQLATQRKKAAAFNIKENMSAE